MTDRKLFALALAVTMGLATLTGMGTYGFLTDSESVEITFSGNVAGNQAGNTPTSGTALAPSSAGTEDSSTVTENADTETETTSTGPNDSEENRGKGIGTGNSDAGTGTVLPTNPGTADLLAPGRNR